MLISSTPGSTRRPAPPSRWLEPDASLYQSDRGSFVREEDGTGLYERDVFAFQAAKRLAVLDAEHEGLVSAGWTAPTARSATSAGSASAMPTTSPW